VLHCGIAFGLGYGIYQAVDWALGTDVLPHKDQPAKDLGVWHISWVLPQSLATIIVIGRPYDSRRSGPGPSARDGATAAGAYL